MKTKNEKQQFVEPDEKGQGFWVWEHSVYPRGSVLAGQQRRRRVKCFDTIEAAKTEFPDATVSKRASSHAMNKFDVETFERSPAPAWLDPSAAGEEW